MTRSDLLASLIGQPWQWNGGNCWDFAAHIQRELFGRILPSIAVPDGFSRRWVIKAFDGHPERQAWREVAEGPNGLIAARDGALVLMAHLKMPAHIGVWLRPESRVIHCDGKTGVCFETPLALRQQGWKHLRFFEPKE